MGAVSTNGLPRSYGTERNALRQHDGETEIVNLEKERERERDRLVEALPSDRRRAIPTIERKKERSSRSFRFYPVSSDSSRIPVTFQPPNSSPSFGYHLVDLYLCHHDFCELKSDTVNQTRIRSKFQSKAVWDFRIIERMNDQQVA